MKPSIDGTTALFNTTINQSTIISTESNTYYIRRGYAKVWGFSINYYYINNAHKDTKQMKMKNCDTGIISFCGVSINYSPNRVAALKALLLEMWGIECGGQ